MGDITKQSDNSTTTLEMNHYQAEIIKLNSQNGASNIIQNIGIVSGARPGGRPADYKTQAAVCREIEIIGEASNRLTPEFQLAHPEIPWSEIMCMRNIVAHNYDGIGLYALWQVANTGASELVTQIEAIFKLSNNKSSTGYLQRPRPPKPNRIG